MQRGQYSEVTAIASRDRTQGRSRRPVARDSEGVRVCTRRSWTIRTSTPSTTRRRTIFMCRGRFARIQAGKHVLVEKPVALDARRSRHAPARSRAPSAHQSDGSVHVPLPSAVGSREGASSTTDRLASCGRSRRCFSYYGDDPMNVRNQRDIGGGGGLMDIGCYPISLSRWIFGAEPSRVVGTVEFIPRSASTFWRRASWTSVAARRRSRSAR